MKISLIGMSGVGKSFWSVKLKQEAGFKRICCDDFIRRRFAKKLNKMGIKNDYRSIAAWKGLPSREAHFRDIERMQVEYEQKVMEDVCHRLEVSSDENIIVDTSGSLVYINDSVIQRLKKLTKMVYIVAGKEQEQELFNDEVIFKQPLVWGDAYRPKPDESREAAMRRCFSDLISWRSKQYERWADISIPYIKARKEVKTAKELIRQFI